MGEYMNGDAPGQGYGRGGRGRRRVRRQIRPDARYWCYAPVCGGDTTAGTVFITPAEIELLRLIDLIGMKQEEAAAAMGVSRKTVWRDLHEARRKLADALIHGRTIEISGCSERGGDECRSTWESPDGEPR